LPHALPDSGSTKGSHRRSSTALRLMKKPWLAERVGSPCRVREPPRQAPRRPRWSLQGARGPGRGAPCSCCARRWPRSPRPASAACPRACPARPGPERSGGRALAARPPAPGRFKRRSGAWAHSGAQKGHRQAVQGVVDLAHGRAQRVVRHAQLPAHGARMLSTCHKPCTRARTETAHSSGACPPRPASARRSP